ncbi:MAG: cytochrome c [Verrucomicrobiales bacterium]|nr:cytochrome c [Verrucomicrobiales bacterium]
MSRFLGLFVAGALLPAAGAGEPPPLFLRACAPCHGKDGKANTPQGRKLGVKDMTQSRLSEAELRQQILDGKAAPDGSIRMPSFRETLKAEEIDALAKYAKGLQVTPPSAGKPTK